MFQHDDLIPVLAEDICRAVFGWVEWVAVRNPLLRDSFIIWFLTIMRKPCAFCQPHVCKYGGKGGILR